MTDCEKVKKNQVKKFRSKKDYRRTWESILYTYPHYFSMNKMQNVQLNKSLNQYIEC